jgi:sugar phosphate isomerase/epimerase
MADTRNQFTVFTKPWQEKSLPELAALIKEFGFDGVELPVRDGYQVTPEAMATELPEAARIFAANGLKIGSVACNLDEAAIAACGEAGVPLLRICQKVDMDIGYLASEEKIRREYDAIVPALDRHGVTLGVQNHCGKSIGSAIGTLRLIEKYDPKHVAIVLDPSHCGLDGEPEDMAIDIVWERLALVNLKNALHTRENGPESEDVRWKIHWTSGRQGITSWPAVVKELRKRGYRGDYCLSAEFSNPAGKGILMEDAANRLVAEDLAYAKSLFG